MLPFNTLTVALSGLGVIGTTFVRHYLKRKEVTKEQSVNTFPLSAWLHLSLNSMPLPCVRFTVIEKCATASYSMKRSASFANSQVVSLAPRLVPLLSPT